MTELLGRLRPRLGVGPHIVAVVLALGLAVAMAVEPTRQLMEQRDRIALMKKDLSALESSNRALERRISRLQDPDYLERRARAQGLVRPGERLYVVLPPSRTELQRRQREARQDGRERPAGFLERALHFIGVG